MSEDDLNGAAPPDLDEVRRRLNEIRASKRGRVRWRISKHTAELALQALGAPDDASPDRRPSGKTRRRKRRKRLL